MRRGRYVPFALACAIALTGLACNAILGITDLKVGNGQFDAVPQFDARVCNAGAPCTPANHCHTGVSTCTQQGDMMCVDTGTNLKDGTACAGGVCTSGVCSDPCGTVSCNTPPANVCIDIGGLKQYMQQGTCDSTSGSAVCSYTSATVDCTAMGKECVSGACMSPPDAAAPPPDA